MIPGENKLIAFIRKHILVLIVIFATLATLYARYCFRDYISGDMKGCLLAWFDTIREQGGIRGLGEPVGDYNIPYQTIIALFTYLPFRPEYMYKGLSIAFDYLLAWAVAQLVYDLTRQRLLQVIAYVGTAGLPIVVLNSAAWGQCDSIYTFFCVLSLLLLLRKRYLLCFIAYGAAFAFKLQAVFLLPFFLFAWLVRERVSIAHFLLIPAVDAIMCLPGMIEGQGLQGMVKAYLGQVNVSRKIMWNYPSFWGLLINNKVGKLFEYFKVTAIGTTMLVLLCILVLLLKRGKAFSDRQMLEIAFIMTFTCVFFLPAMHERYSYLYLILGLGVTVINPATLPAFLALLLIDMQTYGMYLFNLETMPWVALSLLNLAAYAFYLLKLGGPILRESAQA